MKDSEIIARLIYASVTPFPSDEDLDAFIIALGCYARQLQREEAGEIPNVYTVPAPKNTICVMGPGAEHVKIFYERNEPTDAEEGDDEESKLDSVLTITDPQGGKPIVLHSSESDPDAQAQQEGNFAFSVDCDASMAGSGGASVYDSLKKSSQPASQPASGGANDGGDVTASAFAGKGAAEKKRIHARLLEFCAARPGASRKIAAATNGILEDTQIYMMRQSGKFTMAQWRTVDAAMDHIEDQEKAEKE